MVQSTGTKQKKTFLFYYSYFIVYIISVLQVSFAFDLGVTSHDLVNTNLVKSNMMKRRPTPN